jgi:hypothetical protein
VKNQKASQNKKLINLQKKPNQKNLNKIKVMQNQKNLLRKGKKLRKVQKQIRNQRLDKI